MIKCSRINHYWTIQINKILMKYATIYRLLFFIISFALLAGTGCINSERLAHKRVAKLIERFPNIIDTTTKSTFTMKRCKCWGIRRGQRTYSKASLMFWITFASSILQPIPNSLCKRSTMPWSLMCSRSTMLRSPSLKFLKNWSTLLIDYLRKSSLINVHLLAFWSLMVQIRII